MTAQWILGWWNLIYVVPFGLALLYLGVYTVSGITFGDTDADVDADADLDADADTDISVDTDVDADTDITADTEVDADADADADTDADADHDMDISHAVDSSHGVIREHSMDAAPAGASPLWSMLSFLGIGKVPVSIVLMILLLSWGAVGFVINQLARSSFTEPWQLAGLSLPLAAIASLMITSGTSRAINRFMPLNVTMAKRRHELLGAVGEVVLQVDEKFGMVNVREPGGDLHQVPCRLENANAPLPKGARVKLVAYNAKETMFYVLPDTSDSAVSRN